MTTRQFQESSALRIFLSYFKPHRKLFFLDMCCALMIAVIDLAFPYVSRWCMYQLLPEPGPVPPHAGAELRLL